MHTYGNFMGFGWFIPLFVVAAIFYFLRKKEKSPSSILKERLAKGEIDETEYLQKKKLL